MSTIISKGHPEIRLDDDQLDNGIRWLRRMRDHRAPLRDILIEELLRRGQTWTEISDELGCSKKAISPIAAQLGNREWDACRRYLEGAS